jgi:hypothetical protein
MVATPLKASQLRGFQLDAQQYYQELLGSSEHSYLLLAAVQSGLLGGAADAPLMASR